MYQRTSWIPRSAAENPAYRARATGSRCCWISSRPALREEILGEYPQLTRDDLLAAIAYAACIREDRCLLTLDTDFEPGRLRVREDRQSKLD